MISVADDINKFQSLPASKKMMVIAIVAFVFIVSIILGSIVAKNYLRNPNSLPDAVSADKTNLSLIPASQTVSVGEKFTVNVVLDSVPVTVADIELNYDPKLVRIDSIENGTVFASLFNQKIEDSRVIFSGAVDLNDRNSLVTGTMATINATALEAGEATISFGSEFTGTAKNGERTLGEATGTTISIK